MKVDQKDWYKKAEAGYAAMAKVWNSLPGDKLYKDKDCFKISYCYHKAETRETAKLKNGIEYCKACGYPPPYGYDG